MPAPLTAGRAIYTLTAFILTAGTYLADFNAIHIYNPNWPPHAKFHTGQTMSMSLVLSLVGLYLAWRLPPSSANTSASQKTSQETELQDSWAAMLVLDVYWITQAMAFAYPNTSYVDPEFRDSVPPFPPQAVVELLCVSLNAWAYALERRRLGGGREGLKEL